MAKEELDFPSIGDAEKARQELIEANIVIDDKMSREKLDDGEPRGTDRWNEWHRRATHKKLSNQARIRLINLWIKNYHRTAASASKPLDEIVLEAKTAFYNLLDFAKRLASENMELKRGREAVAADGDCKASC